MGSFTSCAEVTNEILDLLNLINSDHQIEYGLYEVFGDIGTFILLLIEIKIINNFNEERIIWPQERLCDIISKWETYKQTVEAQGLNTTYHILFKQQIFLNPKEEVKDETRNLLVFNSVPFPSFLALLY